MKLTKLLLSRNGKITIVYSGVMLITAAVSTLDARLYSPSFLLFQSTVMLLLTELISAPDDKSIGIEYCQKISEKVLPIPISILHAKSIADTCANTQKVLPVLLIAIPTLQYSQPCCHVPWHASVPDLSKIDTPTTLIFDSHKSYCLQMCSYITYYDAMRK